MYSKAAEIVTMRLPNFATSHPAMGRDTINRSAGQAVLLQGRHCLDAILPEYPECGKPSWKSRILPERKNCLPQSCKFFFVNRELTISLVN